MFRTPSDQHRAAQSAIDNACDCCGGDAYGLEEADMDVAADLVKADEVAELVEEVRESLPLLRWVADQEIPGHLISRFRLLIRKAEALDKAVDAKLDNWRDVA